MPEGDHNFESWYANLKEVSSKSPIPVILKETGFGMNEATIKTSHRLKYPRCRHQWNGWNKLLQESKMDEELINQLT